MKVNPTYLILCTLIGCAGCEGRASQQQPDSQFGETTKHATQTTGEWHLSHADRIHSLKWGQASVISIRSVDNQVFYVDLVLHAASSDVALFADSLGQVATLNPEVLVSFADAHGAVAPLPAASPPEPRSPKGFVNWDYVRVVDRNAVSVLSEEKSIHLISVPFRTARPLHGDVSVHFDPRLLDLAKLSNIVIVSPLAFDPALVESVLLE